MWRWILCILLILIGVGAIGLGLYIEIEVQYEVGDWHGMANLLWGGEIRDYRELAFLCLTLGPLSLLCAYLLRPRGKSEVVGRTRKTEPWSPS